MVSYSSIFGGRVAALLFFAAYRDHQELRVLLLIDGLGTPFAHLPWRAVPGKNAQGYSTIGVSSSFIFFSPSNFLAMFGSEGSKLLNSRLNLQLVVPYR